MQYLKRQPLREKVAVARQPLFREMENFELNDYVSGKRPNHERLLINGRHSDIGVTSKWRAAQMIMQVSLLLLTP